MTIPCFIARHLLCPLHERWLGRATFARLRQIERDQWRSPVEVRLGQQRLLRSILRHAALRVPYYSWRWRQKDAQAVGEGEIRTALHSLPTISKNDIRNHSTAFTWPDVPGGLHPYTTGGSSGNPLHFFIDRSRQASDIAARILTHRWFGVDVGHRELWLWGCPIELSRADRLRRLRDRFFNHRLLNAFDLSPDRMREYTEIYRGFRPQGLFGYPSTLSRWAEFILHHNLRLPLEFLRAVFVTGEVCDSNQRQTLEACFRVPVADGYGSREGGFIAHQCPEGSMHVMATEVFVEVLDGDRPIPEGQTGEIVITHLHARGMPFIRYRTGDLGRLLPGRCPCGRGWPRMDRVQGRRTDCIYLPDGRFMHGLSVIYVLRAAPEVEKFQVLQEADYALHVQVVLHKHTKEETLRRIQVELRRAVAQQIPVHVHRVQDIDPARSGKHRPVISKVESMVRGPSELTFRDKPCEPRTGSGSRESRREGVKV